MWEGTETLNLEPVGAVPPGRAEWALAGSCGVGGLTHGALVASARPRQASRKRLPACRWLQAREASSFRGSDGAARSP